MHRPALLLTLALAAPLAAQIVETGAAAYLQACRDATRDAVVLNLAAHPDDEAASTIVWLRRQGFRTVTLYTTGGEGGQNAIGRDIGAALARIRRDETLAAARHTGTEVRWLGCFDFGFSKSLEETLAAWGRDELLRRVAAVLDELQPDLVITNHVADRGHGHHRATFWAAQQLLPQRAIPLLVRHRAEGGDGKGPDPALVVDVGRIDPIRGLTYARQAHDGFLEHRSQGPFGPHDAAAVRPVAWVRIGDGTGDPIAALPDALAAPELPPAMRELGQRLQRFATERPRAEQLADAAELLPRLRELAADEALPPRLRSRLQWRAGALQRILLAGHGVGVVATVQRALLPGGPGLELRVVVQAEQPELVGSLSVRHGDRAAAGDDALVRKLQLPHEPASDGSPAELVPQISFTLAGSRIELQPRLEVRAPPRLGLAFDRDLILVAAKQPARTHFASLDVDYHGGDAVELELKVHAPPGVTVTPSATRVRVSPEDREAAVWLRITVDPQQCSQRAELKLQLGSTHAALVIAPVDAEIPPGLRVGLVRGPDDTLLRALEDLGIDVVELDPRALARSDLTGLSTLVLDIRARHHRPDLDDQRDRILDFCARGGRVVAFYHKPGEWNARAGRPLLAPFPLEVGDQRVAEEDAEVQILAAEHRLLVHPHRITSAEFAGWTHERGLNFAKSWDAAWQPLLRMHDRGEAPLDGALLATTHGQGTYVYCSLALYRQWRDGHQGALRLLVNLLAP